ncbi:GNAT family N-acetyltransferase [Roseovarius faecimaris]|uniref:GNAT family N-acetyltransferase n=1 Tax=Roseovarius faecimaris TaxID=2494550 RepID=A0A6I6IP76_9RHOB|nr:GNAT family N-acetyltransferase [Roseovarius faecimaris]QGX98082.1 GNAT family N-acetyltransferase [Roseovarius faecimaris]
MTSVLRPARSDELETLSALCLRSKAYWGYDAAFMTACREELTLRDTKGVIVIEGDIEGGTGPLGLAQVLVTDDIADLELLYVHPDAIGQGLGRRLFDWCMAEARAQGATKLHIEADPHAAAFYEAMGAVEVGRAPSGSIPGRFLPRLIRPL